MTKETTLVKSCSTHPVLVGNEQVIANVRDTLKGERFTPFTMPRIGLPRDGSPFFVLPSFEAEGNPVKDFTAFVLVEQRMRTYFEKSYEETGGGENPDCSSRDGGKTGVGNPGGECAECPFAVYDEEHGSSRCTEQRMMILLLDSDKSILPAVMMLSEYGAGKNFSKIKANILNATMGTGSIFTVKMKFWAEPAVSKIKKLPFFVVNGAPVVSEAPTDQDLERLTMIRTEWLGF